MGLSARQKLALNRSTAPINLWYGSVRSSKTFAQMWDFIARMASTSGEGVNLIVGHSTNTVWRNFFQPILSRPEFEAVAPHLRYRRNAPVGTLFGKEFSVVGANNNSSWIAIQGLTILNCWGDEAVSWPESFWDMLLTRLSLPDSRLLATCNPGTAGHYLKTRVIDQQHVDPDLHAEKFLLEQNPALSSQYVQRLHRQYTGLFRRRMINAEWVAAEGAVYQMWDPDTMVGDAPPQLDLIAVGVDYGVTNPTAGVAIGLDDDGVLWVASEWAPNPGAQRRTDTQLVDSYERWEAQITDRWGPLPRQFADPSAASYIEELRVRHHRVYKASNAVIDGIGTVSSLLDAGALKIDSSCPHLIGEISEYRWDPKATEQGKDQPIKLNDHHVDALRYAVHSSRNYWRRRILTAGRGGAD